MRTNEHLFEADAFLVVGSAAGGTGSGVTPIMAKVLKERYMDKPVYALIVLPFEHEEEVEERAIYNAALCLKAVSSVADAIILVDNQRYIRKDTSLKSNISRINELIVEPFYNLLCAGEEQKPKYIGTRMLDSGDIKYSLSGWTAIGFGVTRLPQGNLPWEKPASYMRKSQETQKGIQVMDEAISEMSIACKPADAGRALFLLTAPAKEMNVDLVKELCDFLKNIAPQAIIRNGDYPRDKGRLGVTVVLSQLGDVAKVREYYKKSAGLVREFNQRKKALSEQQLAHEEESRDVPTLL
jgi:cell division GTPase FtsZ